MTERLNAAAQFFAIVVLCVLASVTYGVLHDQITARVCLEYFTIGHPPVFSEPVESPTVIGIVWGVIATWWVGVGLGIPLALASRIGPRPKREVGSLVRPIATLMAITGALALLFGVVGYVAASYGWVRLPEPMASRVRADRHVGFMVDLWAHSASYLFGSLGGVFLIVRTWLKR